MHPTPQNPQIGLGDDLTLFVPRSGGPHVELGGRHQRAGGAHLDAVAAVDARRVRKRDVVLGGHVRVEAAPGDVDDEALLPLLAAGVDALIAEDALRVVAYVEVVVDLDRLGNGRRVGAVAIGIGAVLGVPLGDVRRQRQIDRRAEELQHHPAGMVDTFGPCVYHHVGLDRTRARRHQRP